MSSILTNNGAMVALQTLKSINNDLSKTQSQISTGKNIASAKDNASVWAISKVMESDVKGFQGISDSLALGQSTLAVAAGAAESVTDLLTDIKGKIVAAQESNVDREKIQTDIEALTSQIDSIVGAAQFNGLNLVKGTEDVDILSSMDRAANGNVSASHITINRQDLSTTVGTYGSDGDLSDRGAESSATVITGPRTADIEVTYAASENYTVSIGDKSVTVDAVDDDDVTESALAAAINNLGIEGVSARIDGNTLKVESMLDFDDVQIEVSHSGGGAITVDGSSSATVNQRAETITFNQAAKVNDGDSFRVTYGGNNYDYIAGKGETMEDVARGLKIAIDSAGLESVSTKVTQNDTGEWELNIANHGSGDVTDLAFDGKEGGTASGGLFGLKSLDVTTEFGAENALGTIETLINNSIDAAAEFGSAQGRIETQTDFVSNLTDSLKSGIGAMVDADMEEASARLQALQVQQQLGVQSLSIANQAPQTILSLFR
ncbi:flagellin [Celeribacter sp.]|uniref:flagellin n=1 Tax=Celeribacter sp. TaxID=1890673 RepID=UPI003A93B2C4